MGIDRDTIEVSDNQLHDADLLSVFVPFMAQNLKQYYVMRRRL